MKPIVARSLVTTFFLIILVFILASSVLAGIRQSDDKLFNAQTERILDKFPVAGSEPPCYLHTGQDVYLIVSAGARYTDIKLLAQPSVNGATLARALDNSVARTWLAGRTVEWSVDEYSVAEVSATGRGSGLSSSTTIPLGALTTGIRSAGYTPHVLLRTPRYGRTSLIGPASFGTKTRLWYAGRNLAGVGNVSVSYSLPVAFISSVIFAILMLAAFLGCLAFTGIRFAGNFSEDISAARAKFQSITGRPAVFAIGIAVALPLLLISSAYGPMYGAADVLFGSNDALPVVFSVQATSAILFLLYFTFVIRYAKHRFGPSQLAVSTADMYAAMTPEERALTKRRSLIQAAPHLLMSAIFGLGLLYLHSHVWLSRMHFLNLFVVMAVGPIATTLYARRINALTRKSDDSLTWKAQQIARQFSNRIHAVYIDESGRGRIRTFYQREGDNILLSRKLCDTMSDAEIEFVLTIAAIKPLRSSSFKPFLPLLILTPGLLFLLLVSQLVSFPIPVTWIALVVPVTMIVAIQQSLKVVPSATRFKTDLVAVGSTSNTAAALSALAKLAGEPKEGLLNFDSERYEHMRAFVLEQAGPMEGPTENC